MKSSTSRKAPNAPLERFVLNRSRGEKISAVEGMRLTERMKRVLDRGANAGLSGEELRSTIRKHAKG